ncbi:hypothetical protein AAC387_Pa02g0817 [Persea americana]
MSQGCLFLYKSQLLLSKENPNLFLEEEGQPLSLLYVWVGIHARLPQERYYKFVSSTENYFVMPCKLTRGRNSF